jgi:FlaA1/EpsC-like NDP-sugar epimerase
MMNRSVTAVLGWPRFAKQALALCVDALLCAVSVYTAQLILQGAWLPLPDALWQVMGLSLVLAVPVFVKFGLYRAIFRYAGWAALMALTRAVLLYGVLFVAVLAVWQPDGVPKTLGVLQALLLLLGVGAARAVARYGFNGADISKAARLNRPRVLVYGAGSAGRQLAAALANSHELQVVGFLDDDFSLQGHLLNGLQIYKPALLQEKVTELGVSDVFLAIPSATRQRRNEILDAMRRARVFVRTLPGVVDLAQGRVQISDLRELEIEDLLGREPVAPQRALMATHIRGQVVMVTGAGGSIGSELCRQIIQCAPAKLLLVEMTEFALYAVHQNLLNLLGDEDMADVKLVPLLASVCDSRRMHEIISTWRPHAVYHAAAYKHVPLVEHNPAEGVKNNVLGTLTTAWVAASNGVSEFVLVSTDKAVRPTNIMGASKRLAEMVLQAMQHSAAQMGWQTRFSMVRFGNVLGSSGSVVPLFRKQIKDGGPITLTHEDITRYFMTIPEAAQLVIQAGAMAQGGDVFVLDMGEPVKIIDLARRMVELSGLSIRDDTHPQGDIEIAITGLRPGEKLYEELLIGDNPLPTEHVRIMKAHEDFLPWEELQQKLDALTSALGTNDVPQIRTLLKELVPGYQPDGEVVDWVHLKQQEKQSSS